jgi:hypothetical protein
MSSLIYLREGVFNVCTMCVNMFYIVLLAGSNTRRKQFIIIEIVYTCILWHYRCPLFSTSARMCFVYVRCVSTCSHGKTWNNLEKTYIHMDKYEKRTEKPWSECKTIEKHRTTIHKYVETIEKHRKVYLSRYRRRVLVSL